MKLKLERLRRDDEGCVGVEAPEAGKGVGEPLEQVLLKLLYGDGVDDPEVLLRMRLLLL